MALVPYLSLQRAHAAILSCDIKVCALWTARRQLSYNQLTGTIPATWMASETTGFHMLRYLDLRQNQLAGTLPEGLGRTLCAVCPHIPLLCLDTLC